MLPKLEELRFPANRKPEFTSEERNVGAMTETSSSDRSFLHGHSEGGVWDKAGAPTGEDAWNPVDLGGGVYMLAVGSGNPGGTLGLFISEDSSVLIDSGLQKAAEMTLATTERLAGGPVEFLVSTHLHGDHVGCNTNYAAAGATIIAHEDTRCALAADSQFDKAGLPTMTFRDKASLHLGGQTLELIHFPNAHTVSDTIVRFVDADIIHAGDLFFNKIYPFIDLDNGGSLDGFIGAQKEIVELAGEDTRIIAGHGPLGSKAEMQDAIDLLLAIKARVKPLVDEGMSMEDVLRLNPLAPFEKLSWFHITTERMTKIVYFLLSEG